MTTDLKAAREIELWRRRRLLESGFAQEVVAQLAADARYDLHALIELTDRGCPPHLAVRIIAPLEEAAA